MILFSYKFWWPEKAPRAKNEKVCSQNVEITQMSVNRCKNKTYYRYYYNLRKRKKKNKKTTYYHYTSEYQHEHPPHTRMNLANVVPTEEARHKRPCDVGPHLYDCPEQANPQRQKVR